MSETTKVDHVAEARRLLDHQSDRHRQGYPGSPDAIPTAQVHALLAIAGELKRLIENLGDLFGDDSKLDRIMQAMEQVGDAAEEATK